MIGLVMKSMDWKKVRVFVQVGWAMSLEYALKSFLFA